MENPGSVSVSNVGKRFRKYSRNRPNTFVEALSRGFQRLTPTDHLWALKDVSFEVGLGQMIGIVGHNGAGKSTLLRLLGGVGRPDQGTITVDGRIGALLDLGVGFHPELTGRENVFVSGVIAGLTRHEIAQRFDDIVAFAELEQFVDSPLRTYSNGMQMRLAFAVAAYIDPDVLLIDEVLAVGDYAFQQKCLARIEAFRAKGCTIILVTHDISFVRTHCDQALWLEGGEIVGRGSAETVIRRYESAMQTRTIANTPQVDVAEASSSESALIFNKTRFGSQEIVIDQVQLTGDRNHTIDVLQSSGSLTINICYKSSIALTNPNVGFSISGEDGTLFFDQSKSFEQLGIQHSAESGTITVTLGQVSLNSGTYYVDVGIYKQDWQYAYDYHWHAYPLTIEAPTESKGSLWTPTTWQANK